MGTPPPSDSPVSSSSSGTPGTWWWVGAVGAALVFAVGGYALGQSRGTSSAEDDYAKGEPKYEQIYNAGLAAGERAGKDTGEQQGKKEGVAAGEKAGFERGEQQGEKEGEAAGLQEGQAEGRAAGATAALTFTSWNTGAPYIVRMAQGTTNGVPYSVSTRTEMVAGKAYALCTGSATQVCVTDDSGASGG